MVSSRMQTGVSWVCCFTQNPSSALLGTFGFQKSIAACYFFNSWKWHQHFFYIAWKLKPFSSMMPKSTLVLLCQHWKWVLGLCISSLERGWPAEWSSLGLDMVKRNMVVADDAAFREKSKLLTSMERQKWLNSYMKKLLVVNSSSWYW